MDEQKTKELIKLFIDQYYEVISGDSSPEVKTKLLNFIKDNKVSDSVAGKLYEITGTEFKRGTPQNPVDDIYAKYIVQKKGGTRNRKQHRKQSKYRRHKRTHRRRARRGGKLMFNGSYPSAPVVCLAGNSKIPCTAFSSA